MQRAYRDDSRGFTLIELMIVVAIVAVLAAIALPTYQNYIARAQVAESVSAASSVKTAITVFRASNGAWPAAGQFDDFSGGRYTASVTHDDAGIITTTLRAASPVNSRVRGFRWQLTPRLSVAGGSEIVEWTCGDPTPATSARFLPSGCQ